MLNLGSFIKYLGLEIILNYNLILICIWCLMPGIDLYAYRIRERYAFVCHQDI